MIDCHYRRLSADGEFQVFESTDGTRSNWDPEIQHGSPPLALMTKLIEEQAGDSGLRVGRLTLDILGAIPVTRLRVRSWVERPGARISMMAAEMLAPRPDGSERAVARVTAWLLATSDTADAATDRLSATRRGRFDRGAAQLGGRQGVPRDRQLAHAARCRGRAVGGLVEPAGSVWWIRSRRRTLQRLAMVVDSANGAGAALDPEKFVFMNTDTVVHLHRLPVGNDFALRARGSIGPDGIGVTTADLFDRQGFIGTSAQTLLVQRRP